MASTIEQLGASDGIGGFGDGDIGMDEDRCDRLEDNDEGTKQCSKSSCSLALLHAHI